MVWSDLNFPTGKKQFHCKYFLKTVMIMIVFVVMMGCILQKETTNNTDSITIEEYACEGICPVYTLTFYSNRL